MLASASTMRARWPVALAALLLLTCVNDGAHARFLRFRPQGVPVLQLPSPTATVLVPVPNTVRAVNDVGPAVKNATEKALARAKFVLERYADTIRVISIPAGIIVAFVGYFLLTPVLFASGLLVGGGVALVALRALLGNASPGAVWAAVVGTIAFGLVVGLIAVKMLSVGMFAVGATLGVVIASALKPSVLGHVYPPNADVGFVIGAVVIGLILGFIALRFQKQMVIFATAYGGAFAFFFGIGYFAGHFPTSVELVRAEKGQVGSWFAAYIGLTALIGTAGAITQFRLASTRPLVRSHGARRMGRRAGFWRRRNDDLSEERLHLPPNEGGDSYKKKHLESKDASSNLSVQEPDSTDGAFPKEEAGDEEAGNGTLQYYGNVNIRDSLNQKDTLGNKILY